MKMATNKIALVFAILILAMFMEAISGDNALMTSQKRDESRVRARVRRSTSCEQRNAEFARILLGMGWRKYRYSSKDYWYKVFTEKSSYHSASDKCSSMGATLAAKGLRIPSIRGLVISNQVRPSGHRRVWIGLRELQHSWYWVDNVISTRTNTNWYPNEPNSRDERCGDLLKKDNDYLVNDENCNRREVYLCEKVF